MNLGAAGFHTRTVRDALKSPIPCWFCAPCVWQCVHWFYSSLLALLIPAEKPLMGSERTQIHPLTLWVTWPGLLVTPFSSACSELCPFASFSGSRHILCKESLSPGWQEEAGWLLLSNV